MLMNKVKKSPIFCSKSKYNFTLKYKLGSILKQPSSTSISILLGLI
jgi:hypothetical protein